MNKRERSIGFAICLSLVICFTACTKEGIDETEIEVTEIGDNGGENSTDPDCPEFICEQFEANIGDPCETILVPEGGILNDYCECVPEEVEVDCQELGGNWGDPCETEEVPEGGIIDPNCQCVENQEFDCMNWELNYGDSCEEGGFVGVIDENCECIPE